MGERAAATRKVWRRYVGIGVALLSLTGASAPARGNSPPTSAGDRSEAGAKRPIVFAISGGASLGAYEGGFLYALIEDLRELSEVVEPRCFSGTSAGAINAFISVLQTCSSSIAAPRDSAFYRTWMPISFDSLFERSQVDPVAALSRSALATPIADLQSDFQSGLRPDCDMLLGITATRVKPRVVTQAEGRLRFARMAAQFMFRVTGRGDGRPPNVANHVGPRDRALPQLPLDGPKADAFGALRDLILASSAFPLAFAPVEVSHCPGQSGQMSCRSKAARADLFLDGGIFDQNPISLGVDELTDTHGTPLPAARMYLLDPFQRVYPQASDAVGGGAVEDALGYAAKVASGFVQTARAQGAEALLRQDPSLGDRLVVSASMYPPYGELAVYFLSFFEEAFREFDFILGIIESKRALNQAQNRAILLGDLKMARAMARAQRRDLSAHWDAYRCVQAILGDRYRSSDRVDALCEA
ncbi:MAG: patatin-like phospholipase family protein, partial [Myxococcota bacterium]